MSLVSILASPLLGSVTGSLFQWLNRREERALAREKMAAEAKLIELQNAHAILVAEKQLAATIKQGEIEIGKVEASAFVESQKPAGSSRSEMLKSWMRAALVSYTALVCLVLTCLVARQIGGIGAMDKYALTALFAEAVAQFFFMFGLAFSWFFGARGTAGSTTLKAKS